MTQSHTHLIRFNSNAFRYILVANGVRSEQCTVCNHFTFYNMQNAITCKCDNLHRVQDLQFTKGIIIHQEIILCMAFRHSGAHSFLYNTLCQHINHIPLSIIIIISCSSLSHYTELRTICVNVVGISFHCAVLIYIYIYICALNACLIDTFTESWVLSLEWNVIELEWYLTNTSSKWNITKR